MKKLGNFTFPESPSEAQDWQEETFHYALSMKCLAAARTRIEGTWVAYCLDVPGMNHRDEAKRVLDFGARLSERVARAIFPGFTDVPYAK